MITAIRPMAIGNALHLFIDPPEGAMYWRILRNTSDSFAGPDDPNVLIAFEGIDRNVMDAESLTNDRMYFYHPYYFDGTNWSDAPTSTGTPSASYQDVSTDVLELLRDRLEAGLKVEVQRGNFNTELGYVQVYVAAPSLEQNLSFPLVTVHLDSESPGERGIGEDINGDFYESYTGDWEDSDGWLASVKVTVIGWSQNGDERIELRKALRRVIIGNLPVFAVKGVNEVSFSAQDVDAVNGEYVTPMYQVLGSFSCLAPARVVNRVGVVEDVTVTAIVDDINVNPQTD